MRRVRRSRFRSTSDSSSAARGRIPGGDRGVRRDDGRRAGQRRTGHALARAMTPPRVVLASSSPRRRELLTLIGIRAHVSSGGHRRDAARRGAPRPHAERLARGKASVVAEREPNAVIIAADTIVVVDGDILGKPRDEAEAECHAAPALGAPARRADRGRRRARRRRRVRRRIGRRHLSRAVGGGYRALHRHPRADGQGRRVRHPGLRRDDRHAASTATTSP